MSDYNSELPIRSQLPSQVNPDDVIVKIGDATNPTTQLTAVDTNGSLSSIIKDASGNAVTTELNGSHRALDVMTQNSGSATGGTAANFSGLAGGIHNSTPPTLTNGQQVSLQLDSAGRLLVDATSTLPYDTNYGTVGANTLRTAAQIGNATGAADFGAGATTAQTLRTTSNQGTPNTATNAWPTYLTTGGTANSPANPIFVSSSDVAGNSIDNYQTTVALAKGGSTNQDYTVSAGKTFYTLQIWATASGKIKVVVQYETAAASGIFNTFWVGFNSTPDPQVLIPVPTRKTQVTGARIRITITNDDNAAMDVYSTLSGTEQ